MTVGRDLRRDLSTQDLLLGCADCPAAGYNLCDASMRRGPQVSDFERRYVPQAGYTTKARRLIIHEQDFPDAVPIICSGWATSVKLLPDGRRQILSILLPGDIVSAGLLFAPKPGRVVEAITDVHYRTFRRRELKSLLFGRAEYLDGILNTWIAEQKQADRLIVDLGRRSGEERIARLILTLAQRLKLRGMLDDPSHMEFPLRQHHIADAAGLTQVHVSKVISDFRRSGLVEFHQRSLNILDLDGLRRRANAGNCPGQVLYAASA